MVKIWDFFSVVAPFLLAGFSALISEFSGLLNIGIEGLMLFGAFLGVLCISITCSSWGGLLAVSLAIILGGLSVAFIANLSLNKNGNIFILGLSLNLLAVGIVPILSSVFFKGQSIVTIPDEFLISSTLLNKVSFFAVLVLSLFLIFFVGFSKTGVRLRILGNETPLLESLGVNTKNLKIKMMFFSGGLATVAGVLLSLQLGAFVPNQSSGRGWIALVLAFAGGRSFFGVVIATSVFVLIENLVSSAQFGLQHPSITIGIPFLLSLSIIIIQQILKKACKKIHQRKQKLHYKNYN